MSAAESGLVRADGTDWDAMGARPDGVMLSARDNYETWYGPSPDGPGWLNGVRRPLTDADRDWMRACGERASLPRPHAVSDRPASSPTQPGRLAQVVDLPTQGRQSLGQVVDLMLEPHERGVRAVLRQVREVVYLQLVRAQRLAALQRGLNFLLRHRSSSAVGALGAEDTGSRETTVEAPADSPSSSAGRGVGGRLRGLLRPRGGPRSHPSP